MSWWQRKAGEILANGDGELKPPKHQRQPQKWVIESLRPEIKSDWQMASESMASGRTEDSKRMITPRRLETAVNILKAHIKRFEYIMPQEGQYRIRNIKTGEVIPWEALDIS